MMTLVNIKNIPILRRSLLQSSIPAQMSDRDGRRYLGKRKSAGSGQDVGRGFWNDLVVFLVPVESRFLLHVGNLSIEQRSEKKPTEIQIQ